MLIDASRNLHDSLSRSKKKVVPDSARLTYLRIVDIIAAAVALRHGQKFRQRLQNAQNAVRLLEAQSFVSHDAKR